MSNSKVRISLRTVDCMQNIKLGYGQVEFIYGEITTTNDNTNPCLIVQTGSVEGFAGVGQVAIVLLQNLVKA